ncbi:M20 metallopeptidase family protein [Paenarthrobacter sp. NCHU4564]|uniref:M20 metallopeptidase family protein n=1 Tax=Paenarthrobacter sp. NCHU4564 TaxID=3451353 RepID=UPI003F9A4167
MLDAENLHDRLISLRRELHRIPELGLDLPRTTEFVINALRQLGIDSQYHPGSGGVTAIIRGTGRTTAAGARTVLLRADMDALPIEERSDLDFASTNGRMHACGHDLHVAMLLGAAKLLSDRRQELAGDVLLVFQAGEEGYDGARIMVEEGLLELSGSLVIGAYALHVFSGRFAAGTVALRPGPMMAAADRLTVTVHGVGGHGSTPHSAIDPIVVAAEMITALQTMVTRRFDVFDPVVLSVTKVSGGGESVAVIPAEAVFEATVRSFSNRARDRLEELCARTLQRIAEAHGASATVQYTRLYPVTVNASSETQRALRIARDLFPSSTVTELETPLNASEDFSRILDEVPGAFIALGATPAGVPPEAAPFNHSAEATFNEDCLPQGAALLAMLALDRLQERAESA